MIKAAECPGNRLPRLSVCKYETFEWGGVPETAEKRMKIMCFSVVSVAPCSIEINKQPIKAEWRSYV